MKTKIKDYIPIYGVFSYFNRYFKSDKRTDQEAVNAQMFEIYQLVVSFIVFITLLLFFKS